MSTAAPQTGDRIILFDGVCNLCSGSVRFVARRDPHARFQFAALQSATAHRLLQERGREPDRLDSVVLVEEGRLYDKSTAALRIARRLRFPWPLFYTFIIVPRALRDAIYNAVAARRYRWFGRRDECMLPTSDLQGRFLG